MTAAEHDTHTLRLHEQRIRRCGSCHANVVWFITERGRRMPVDAATVQPTDTELDLSRHVSHFATCPNAKQHRKEKR